MSERIDSDYYLKRNGLMKLAEHPNLSEDSAVKLLAVLKKKREAHLLGLPDQYQAREPKIIDLMMTPDELKAIWIEYKSQTRALSNEEKDTIEQILEEQGLALINRPPTLAQKLQKLKEIISENQNTLKATGFTLFLGSPVILIAEGMATSNLYHAAAGGVALIGECVLALGWVIGSVIKDDLDRRPRKH